MIWLRGVPSSKPTVWLSCFAPDAVSQLFSRAAPSRLCYNNLSGTQLKYGWHWIQTTGDTCEIYTWNIIIYAEPSVYLALCSEWIFSSNICRRESLAANPFSLKNIINTYDGAFLLQKKRVSLYDALLQQLKLHYSSRPPFISLNWGKAEVPNFHSRRRNEKEANQWPTKVKRTD